MAESPPDEAISARYEWNADGLADALEAHRRMSRWGFEQVFLRTLLLLFGLATIAIPAVILLPPGDWQRKQQSLPIVIAFFGYMWAMIYLALWSRNAKRRAARKAFRDVPTEALQVEWTFTPDRVSNRTGLSALTYLWPIFQKVFERPKGFLLYLGRNFFHWIPGFGFSSSEAIRRFAVLAGSRVPRYVVLGKCEWLSKPEPVGMDEL